MQLIKSCVILGNTKPADRTGNTFDTMLYFALIGDLDQSRELPDRAAVQRKLQAIILQLNERTTKAAAAPLKLTAGDEVQGISQNPRYMLEVVVALSDALSPQQFSWGLGYGALTTDLSDDVALMDGPCFHLARKALEKTKNENSWFGVQGIEAFPSAMLTAIMNLMGAIREDWTARQTEYVRLARDHTQVEVARMTGKAPSTVSRALRAAKFDRIIEAENAVALLLERFPDD